MDKNKKFFKAEGISLGYQNIAAIWIAIWSTRKFLTEMPTVREIIVSGFAIAACFTPVYFNLIMEKITGRKNKINNEDNTSEELGDK